MFAEEAIIWEFLHIKVVNSLKFHTCTLDRYIDTATIFFLNQFLRKYAGDYSRDGPCVPTCKVGT
jgi:hypothetical protein